jgi:predicted alpha/beta-fold hydrolase
LPRRGKPAGDKLEDARVPVLIVYAANDPLSPAQYVSDLIAVTENPNVAAIMLPGGGHIGFAAYARRYYFSLIVNFFSVVDGPRAASAQLVE